MSETDAREGRDAPPGIDRREAIRRVSALLGGAALVGGSSLLAACERAAERPRADSAAAAAPARIGEFAAADIAFLDEVADTILPDTPKSPGAKAARVGAFMALMVTDGYRPSHRAAFRRGMQQLDAAARAAHGVAFTAAAPAQRLALLETLDRQQHADGKRRDAEKKARGGAAAATPAAKAPGAPPRGTKLGADTGAQPKRADAYLSDQRQENVGTDDVASGAAVVEDDEAPPHYFRMMKELALLGYFTSEIGCTKAQRYVESPGRYDPCATRAPGEPALAPHA
ncbi:MAG TPA: gluconate 2-dehydrogenase subunit 3 family protein [Gemmatirosa sp.]|nr:gluconate 2-dehydrogenase subunit 3 family protein [Gemmatirosa sp.]